MSIESVEAAISSKGMRGAIDPTRAMQASRERRRERDRIRTQQRRLAKKGYHVDVGDLSKKTTAELKKITTKSITRKAYASSGNLQAIEKSKARRRERDRIRAQQRRMALKGFWVDVGDLSKLSTAKLKKITTESLEKKAYATTGEWAGKMTYRDFLRLSPEDKKRYLETGIVPKEEANKYKRRKNRFAVPPEPEPKPKETGPEPQPKTPTVGEVLLDELEQAIAKGLISAFDRSIAAGIKAELDEAIRKYGREGVGVRLVELHNKGVFIPLLRYIEVGYIPRGEEYAARYVFDAWRVYMFGEEPTMEEQRYWDDDIYSSGVQTDPETGEPIT